VYENSASEEETLGDERNVDDDAPTPRILLVEDEEHLAAGLKLNFELEGYAVDSAATVREAARLLLRAEAYAAIILDVMLPDLDGFTLCQRLRDAGNYTPVIMLTARSHPEDRVKGLEAGADDYLVKPFVLDELLARVRSLIRRAQWDKARADSGAQEDLLAFGEAEVNFATCEATMAGVPVHLTRLELDLLRYFSKNPGRVLSRKELLEHVWHLRNYPNTRTVDNFVARLRKHFEPQPRRPVYVLSVRGAGYRFVSGDAIA
jgi:DNA-binding response OmpR family regulator